MSFKIIPIQSFDKELKKLAKKYPSMKMDYSNLLDKLEVNPKSGTPIGKTAIKYACKLAARVKAKAAAHG